MRSLTPFVFQVIGEITKAQFPGLFTMEDLDSFGRPEQGILCRSIEGFA